LYKRKKCLSLTHCLGRRLKTSPKALNLHRWTKYNTRYPSFHFIKQLYFLKFIRIYRREFSVRFFWQTLILPVMLQDFCMLQSQTNLLRHFGTTEKFDLENYLARQICPPPSLPLISVSLPPKSPWWNLSPSKQHWMRGGGNPFCNIVGVSIQGNWEIRTLIAFISTSFVQDCSLYFSRLDSGKSLRPFLMLRFSRYSFCRPLKY